MITYVKNTCINIPPDVVLGQIREFERYRGQSLPIGYVDHECKSYGGVPEKQCFVVEGEERFLGRFFNFLNAGNVPSPKTISWRQTDQDVRLDYSVWYLEDQFDDFPDDDLIPFAGVDVLGINCRRAPVIKAALCFNCRNDVVLADRNELVFVCPSFEKFLAMLKRSDKPTVIYEFDHDGSELF